MVDKIKQYQVTVFKVVAIVIGITALILASIVFTNSQKLADKQAYDSQQTIIEVKQAVNELKASNVNDHQQTVEYINCVLVGITNSSSQSQASVVYKACLESTGIKGLQ